MLLAFKNRCYWRSEIGVTGFQKPVLSTFINGCYRLSLLGVPATNILVYNLYIYFLKDIMVFRIILGGAGKKIGDIRKSRKALVLMKHYT